MTVISHSDSAAQIRQMLTSAAVAEYYGFHPNRAGFIKCPFHSGDTHGSLKLYDGDRGWHCYGCHAGGSVIDFVMKLFELSFREAVAKLNADFALGLSDGRPDRQRLSAALAKRQAEEQERAKREAEVGRLCAEYRECHEIAKYFPPQQLEDGTLWIHPMYAAAIKRMPILEAEINELVEVKRE